jgi:twitching motility protein PilT
MALFGSSRSPLQKVKEAQWRNDEEKLAALSALRDDGSVRPGELVPLLWVSDATVRQAAASMFVGRADAKSIALLFSEMQTQHPAAKAFAQRVIARLPANMVTPAIEELLRDPSTMRQRVGWETALELPSKDRLAFARRALKDAPSIMRVTALQRLVADQGIEALVDELMAFAADPDDRVRERVIEALATLPRPRGDVTDMMLERFAQDNASVRAHALKAIHQAGQVDPAALQPKLHRLLAEGEDAIRRTAVEILLSTGKPEVVLMEILQQSRAMVGWLRTRILNTLKTFGDDVLRPAVSLLEHPDEEVRMQALVLAEHFEDPRLIGPVVKLLVDDDWWLRITACETLGKLKDERVVPHLVKALADPDARWAAIDALGSIGGESALRALVDLLKDDRPEVRMEVLRACARSKDPRMIKLFQRVMEGDSDQEVRTRAAEMYREVGGVVGREQTAAVRSDRIDDALDKLLAMARERGASDVHVTVDEPPYIRVGGVIERLDQAPLDAAQCEALITGIIDPVRRRTLDADGEVDFCHAVPGVGRYRANAFRQRKGMCATFRCIPNIPPTFADLRLPGQLTELLDFHQGLILVTGPAGGGKSTTLAAIINLINETKSDHIITLEDPIEFVHPAKSSLVNQREVGRHTGSFSRALRAALREDPDVIMVGEMRDVETIRMAMTAAETGHLVVATMHTTSAVATVDRLIESFPPEEQSQVRMGLSESLKYVVSQSLAPRADGKGRVAVYEVLKGIMNVGTMIRDHKTFQLPSLMQINRAAGMMTLDQSLEDLLEAGLITPEFAFARAERKETFEARITAGAQA